MTTARGDDDDEDDRDRDDDGSRSPTDTDSRDGDDDRCNEARRMSEGGIVMPSCAAANNNNNTSNNNNNGTGNGSSRTTFVPRRKFSFPAVLHSQILHSDLGGVGGFGGGVGNVGGGSGGPSLTVATARRRFSNVSDVVSRKLSHTIGWRTAVPTDQIARQGKALCVQYVRWKLKRAGAYTKKCAGALRCAGAEAGAAAAAAAAAATAAAADGSYFIPPQTGTSTTAVGGDHDDGVRREVFPAMLRVGLQLERIDPKLYAAGVAAIAAGTVVSDSSSPDAPAAALSSTQHRLLLHRPAYCNRRNAMQPSATAAVVLVAVSRELFRAGAQVTWAKVVSLVCVAAGLAVDCARRGRSEQLPDLIEAVGEVIEDDLAAWIHYNGGWMGLQSYCKPVVVNIENPVFTQIMYLISLLGIIIFLLLLLRWLDFVSVFR
ncbi:Blc2 family,Bcl2-like [Cinara cedri]|uniref:Blc2 family,Bcl2-like n=1 Tax=Cinara cedri TaxID=506608 RepID=A0A5E4NQT7_9HEMI|nr:Blc2 family,Bcl2-like [Cinara cedri]